MKKIATTYSTLGVLLLTLLLAACGEAATPTTSAGAAATTNVATPTTSAGATATTSAVSATTQAGSTNAKLKFMLWSNGPSDQELWSGLVADYQKANPGVTIAVELLDAKQYDQVIKARLAGGEGPDIYGVRPQDIPALVKGGYLSALNGQDWFNSLYPDAQKAFQVDSKAYAFPIMQAGNGIIYNKALFKQYNLTPPPTFDELIKVAQTLKTNNITPLAMSAKDNWWTQFVLYYAVAEHVAAKDPTFNDKVMRGEAKFAENKGWQDSINLYKTLIPYYIPDPLGVGFDQAKALFLQGKSAMFPAPWILEDARKAKLDVGFFNFPTTNDPNSSYLWGGYTIAMGINPKNNQSQAANAFVKWFMEKDNYLKMLTGYKQFPVKEGIDVSNVDPLFAEMQASAKGKTIVGSPNDNWLPGIADTLVTGIQDLTAGRAQPIDVLKKMDEATAKAIKEKK